MWDSIISFKVTFCISSMVRNKSLMANYLTNRNWMFPRRCGKQQ